ncbi:MAG TPA: tRNA preQ1(34) S-adenosylmethionine ribosyltransferase-isomerase QueA [Longimicrobiales bacterium]|nr:tRNA preQ1(34) S-adenosylmethionine ribosyltransferase-isomerase QueA [Longimicrobiales bacterium]
MSGSLPTSAFDYHLPEGRIATHPSARRDESRLLVLERATGRIRHRVFRDLLELVSPGDALVLNDTRVFPARLVGRKATGSAGEVLLLRPWLGPVDAPAAGRGSLPVSGDVSPGAAAVDIPSVPLWEALVRPGSKLKPGRTLDIAEDLSVEIVAATPEGGRVVRLMGPLPPDEAIRRHGRVPLPPYIERAEEPADRERYQTVYARAAGSVAAPTAGLHFTPALLDALEAKGVRLVRLLLHVGVGTFRPVEAEDPALHRMHAEWYEVDEDAARALERTRAEGGAVWAVGTTVVRTLESVTGEEGRVRAGSGWTDIFIRPGHRFRAVDRLITNFHLPRSTLLMLVAAFGGHEAVMGAYHEAVREGYRFYSYGDAMAVV